MDPIWTGGVCLLLGLIGGVIAACCAVSVLATLQAERDKLTDATIADLQCQVSRLTEKANKLEIAKRVR